MSIANLYSNYQYQNIFGKYITHTQLYAALQPYSQNICNIGYSVNNNPIHTYKFGNGKVKLLIWSQMHGNEPTTTKGLLDFIFYINSNEKNIKNILENFTLYIIPILNPDGAIAYTRENANHIDINRDFYNKTQPETKFLLEVYNHYQPNFCFNLHDQRSIFSAGLLGKPATLSFLAPSYNPERSYNTTRLNAVALINHLFNHLNKTLPHQIGRFDDAFNINCAGDYFTSLNTPTILVEAGHYPSDYDREITRKYVFLTLFYALNFNYENVLVDSDLINYLNIPQNFKQYYDIIFKNVELFIDNSKIITNFALQYKEQLIQNKIVFTAFVEEIGELYDKIGHLEYNCEGNSIIYNSKNTINIGDSANFCIGKNKYQNGILLK
ncbi:MAG: M14 family zinc carboxypeptidase [Flavobacterium sp.]|jgi:hypothetical protein